MSAKGLATLQSFSNESKKLIAYVVVAKDNNVTNDFFTDIIELAARLGLPILDRSQTPPPASHVIAVSWRWLIELSPQQQLIVFHDSILPRYRGFAPLASALINGDKQLGVTALVASDEYDKGPIIDQEVIEIDYPLRMSQAIDLLLPCYKSLTKKVVNRIIDGSMFGLLQNEAEATYSLWRDDEDYFIDWRADAHYIQRFVDALGPPYKGAATTIGGEVYRIRKCQPLPDVEIENRDVGKVIFVVNGNPIVVCGTGLLKILELTKTDSETNALPLAKFRSRFVSSVKNPE
ncbi:Bifunctional polymyxin resistance protein ArnA [Pseudomonas fluorescens]|uniref:Bifunctional polymyxin resistance protein ArnA n=2 Tax=Pseudomonas fluorescens TaxID=294 RepID=A0A5E6U1K1_PSEFL|nr:Bifunctional polymyxin resistance protein ArnA [Pseudomonas fluorescens]